MYFLKSLYFLGTKPSILINQSSTHKTLFGGMLSIIVAALLFAGTVYFTRMLLSWENYSIIMTDEYDPDSFKDWTNEPIPLLLLDKLGVPFKELDRIFSMVGTYWAMKDYIDDLGQLAQRLDVKMVDLVKCNLDNIKKDKEMYQAFFDLSTCIKPDQNVNVSKAYGGQNYTGIVIWVTRCRNSTIKNDCHPKEYIESQLINTFLAVKFKDYYFDHKKQNDTGIPFINTEVVQTSSSVYKRMWYNFKNVEYESDDGLIYPTSNILNYTTYANFRETVDIRTETTIPGSFVAVSLNMYTQKTKYKRSYYKGQNMLADLGGLLKGVITLATLMNFYFTDKLYYSDVIDCNIDSLKEIEKKEPNRDINRDLNMKLSKKRTTDGVGSPTNSPSNLTKRKLKIGEDNNNNVYNNRQRSMSILNLADVNNKAKKKNLRSVSNDSNMTTNPKPNFDHKENQKIINFSISQLVLPAFCFPSNSDSKKGLNNFTKLKNIIRAQMDVTHLIRQSNSVDKMTFLLCGENRNLFERCINPVNIDEKNLPLEFSELQEKVIRRLSRVELIENEKN